MRLRRASVRLWAPALAVAALAAAPPPASALDPTSPFGVVAFIPSPTRWDAMAEAGIAWNRCGFDWQIVETAGKGVFNWTLPDEAVAAANARGLFIYAGLGYTPPWASANGDHRNPPANPQDWADYCSAVVERYDGDGVNDMPGLTAPVKHWELWNEPNLSQFFTGTLQQFIDVIIKVGADAVHAADPTAKVVGPELFGGTGSTNPAWMRAVLQQAGDKVDIVSFHQYGGGDVPSGRLAAIDTMRNLIVSEGYGSREIWITECGWHDAQLGGNQTLQAQYLVDMLNGMAARSAWWKKFYWYQIWEGGAPADEKWGLLRVDETRKPVWTAYRDYIAASAWPPGGGGTNLPPTVSLSTPADGATFTAPASITGVAAASDPDGTIARVEFLSGTSVLGEDTDGANGYTLTAPGVPAGTYAVTARATDSGGATTTSSAVNITVNGGGAALPTLNAKPAATIAVDGSPADWTLSDFTATARGGQSEAGDTALVGYSAGTLYHGGSATNASLPTAGADHTAKAYCRHDATYLYFLVRVDDSDVQTGNAVDLNWANDCVEIYLDPANDGGAAALSNSSSDIQLVIDAANRQNVYMATPAYTAQVLAGVTSAVAADATGWWLEARIAKGALDPDAPASGTVGVEFNYRDNDANNDPAQTTVYNWSDTVTSPTAFPNKVPDRWGDLSLPVVGPPPPTNQPPTASLTSPTGGQTFTAPAVVNLAATASDPDGTVARVEFFQGGTKLGEDATAADGFSFNWTSVAAGSYSLTARATDNGGAATTSTAVSITVNPGGGGTNQPPTVSLTSPTAGQSFAAPATVNLAANAADADGTVGRVEFILGTTILATDTTSPYTFAWSNVSAGSYSLTARATDNAGTSTTSAAVSITVTAGSGGTDADGDGLTDADEAARGTNPNNPDSDADGMSDGREVTAGFNPLVADQDANGMLDGLDDWDADGTNNQAELTAGTPAGTAPAAPAAGGGGGGGGGGCFAGPRRR